MDNDLIELENELKRLRPRMPSRALQARIEEELRPRRLNGWAWAALPFAAAIVLLITLWPRPQIQPKESPALTKSAPKVSNKDVYEPVAAENVLYDSQDEGVVTLPNGVTARRVRNSYVDTVIWRNPQTKASLRWSVPRDEVRVVPISFQ